MRLPRFQRDSLPMRHSLLPLLYFHLAHGSWQQEDNDERNSGQWSSPLYPSRGSCPHRYSLPLGTTSSTSGVVSTDGTAFFFGTSKGSVYCADLTNASAPLVPIFLDSMVLDAVVSFPPAIHIGGDSLERVFIVRQENGVNGTLYSVQLNTLGSEGPCTTFPDWSTPLLNPPTSAPRVDDGGVGVLVVTSDPILDTNGALQAFDELYGAQLWVFHAVDGSSTPWGLFGVAPVLDPRVKAANLDRAVFLAYAGFVAAIDLLTGKLLPASKETTKPWRHSFIGAPLMSSLGDELFIASVCSDTTSCVVNQARFSHFSVRGDGVNPGTFQLGAKWIKDQGNASNTAFEGEGGGGGGGIVPCGFNGLPKPTHQGLIEQRRALARALGLSQVPTSCEEVASILARFVVPQSLDLPRILLPHLSDQSLSNGGSASEGGGGGWVGIGMAMLPDGDLLGVGGSGDPNFQSHVLARFLDTPGTVAYTLAVGEPQGSPAVDANGTIVLSSLAPDTGAPVVYLLEGGTGAVIATLPASFPGGGESFSFISRPILLTLMLGDQQQTPGSSGNTSVAVTVNEGVVVFQMGGGFFSCPSSSPSLECSGKGVCGCDTGVCTCDPGSSGVDCNGGGGSPSPSPTPSTSSTPSVSPPPPSLTPSRSPTRTPSSTSKGGGGGGASSASSSAPSGLSSGAVAGIVIGVVVAVLGVLGVIVGVRTWGSNGGIFKKGGSGISSSSYSKGGGPLFLSLKGVVGRPPQALGETSKLLPVAIS